MRGCDCSGEDGVVVGCVGDEGRNDGLVCRRDRDADDIGSVLLWRDEVSEEMGEGWSCCDDGELGVCWGILFQESGVVEGVEGVVDAGVIGDGVSFCDEAVDELGGEKDRV